MVFRRNGEGNQLLPTEYKGETTDNYQPMRENYQKTTKAEGGSGRSCCDTNKINPNNPFIIFRITTCPVYTLLW